MNYPNRKNYPSNWGYQRELRKWRVWNRERIARLEVKDERDKVQAQIRQQDCWI
ncbi:hypothetical protein LCGC14_2497070 [marine sediment metagenome]|uniref:Uncharacterized protein n=1 Tax=marine sediment metagenome TaxID=412755 RepID=A0A0F9BR11_9ZZZZ